MQDEVSIGHGFVAAVGERAEKSVVVFLLVVGQFEDGVRLEIAAFYGAFERFLLLMDVSMSPNLAFPDRPVVALLALVFLVQILPSSPWPDPTLG